MAIFNQPILLITYAFVYKNCTNSVKTDRYICLNKCQPCLNCLISKWPLKFYFFRLCYNLLLITTLLLLLQP